MRRPHNKDNLKNAERTGDIRKDLTEKQLIAFSAAALAYNVLEDQIDALIHVVTNVPDWLIKEVSSRIHGLDGKCAIIHTGIEHSGLDNRDQKIARDSIGAFGELKKIRDAMVHARIIDASIGIGLSGKSRGKDSFEVLLTEEALSTFYDHIAALEKVLLSAGRLLGATNTLKETAPDDPNRSRREEEIRVQQAQFRANHAHRQSLRKLPKFPTESELNAAVSRWREAQVAALMGWFQHPQSPLPQRPTQMSAALWSTLGVQAPPHALIHTPPSVKKKKS